MAILYIYIYMDYIILCCSFTVYFHCYFCYLVFCIIQADRLNSCLCTLVDYLVLCKVEMCFYVNQKLDQDG